MPNPQFPIYIPSKSRADIAYTPRELDRIGVPYRLIVEPAQFDQYAAHFGAEKLLILPDSYRVDFDTCIAGFDDTKSKGSGPARNFAWEHSMSEGHAWHWIIDDNIRHFLRANRNTARRAGDGTLFRLMEDFVLRYRNIAIAGPQYDMFLPLRNAARPLILNTRVFSCILIRNDTGLYWRARYNEDVDLSIRSLKAGWCNVLFNAVLQEKMTTQTMPGGNTEAFYAQEGTRPKSELLARLHPDVVRLVTRYGRPHHHVDFSQWKNRPLVRRDDIEIPQGDPYGLTIVDRGATHQPA